MARTTNPMKEMTRVLSYTASALLLAAAPMSMAADECKAPFPTPVIADYVLGCMAANGNKFETLHQCSCSIDYIAEKMTYEEYEEANTVLQAQLDIGQRGIFYRDSIWAKKRVEKLQRLQAESTLRCF